MSSAADGHAAAHPAHEAHEPFTGEPVDVLPPDEPRTPGWLPVLGIAFFTGAAVLVLATRDPQPGSAAAPPAQAQPAQAQPAVPGRAPLSPEQALDLRRKTEEAMKARGVQPGAVAQPSPAQPAAPQPAAPQPGGAVARPARRPGPPPAPRN
jgi:hypothetical protein